MADAGTQSRSEAVQPSLWDRLVDDLPGLAADTDRRRRELGAEIGAERLERLLAGGRREIEQDTELTAEIRAALRILIGQIERLDFLRQRDVVVTPEVLKQAVRRDIEALFNTERMEARLFATDIERLTHEDPADIVSEFPEVRRSVLNYGVPAFSGRRAADIDAEALARELREVIATFEPRFKREGMKVTVDTTDKRGMRVSIDGILMLSPVPERMRFATTIDLDNGRAATTIEDG
ncbi:MAG: type VI secretion system baseplate subunit TssE [Rhodobacteraceae bacterium]|nr:type VI secretion system baseplate subunit TssE [Paracoccaceae bacterium]